jgi:hypothetical protein
MDATKGSEFWLEASLVSLRRQAATFTLLQAEMACLWAINQLHRNASVLPQRLNLSVVSHM